MMWNYFNIICVYFIGAIFMKSEASVIKISWHLLGIHKHSHKFLTKTGKISLRESDSCLYWKRCTQMCKSETPLSFLCKNCLTMSLLATVRTWCNIQHDKVVNIPHVTNEDSCFKVTNHAYMPGLINYSYWKPISLNSWCNFIWY